MSGDLPTSHAPGPVASGDGAPDPPRAVVFDYGHTLVDFTVAEDRLLDAYTEVRRLLEAEALHDLPQAPELVERLSGRVERMVFESYERRDLEELDIVTLYDHALRALGASLPTELVRQIAELEHRAMVSRLTFTHENRAVLEDLKRLDLKIGVVSNAHFLPDMMRHDLDRLGIARYTDDMVFSAEIGLRKPHPAIFTKVLDALGVLPSQAVFVGDRLRDDVAGAKALGMRGVLTHQFRQEKVDAAVVVPDLVIAHLSDLVPYVRELIARARA